MKIISTNAFTGPNIYAHFPVMRHVLDLGELEQWPTARPMDGRRMRIQGGDLNLMYAFALPVSAQYFFPQGEDQQTIVI